MNKRIILAGLLSIIAAIPSSYAGIERGSGGSAIIGADGRVKKKWKDSGIIRLPNRESITVGLAPVGNTDNWQIMIEKYLANGLADPAFGMNGKVTTAIGTSVDDVISAEAQPDGKILVKAIVDGMPVQVRYNTDGTVDVTFGVNGIQHAEKEKLI